MTSGEASRGRSRCAGCARAGTPASVRPALEPRAGPGLEGAHRALELNRGTAPVERAFLAPQLLRVSRALGRLRPGGDAALRHAVERRDDEACPEFGEPVVQLLRRGGRP